MTVQEIIRMCALEWDISVEDICNTELKEGPAREAARAVVWIARRDGKYFETIARYMNRSSTSVHSMARTASKQVAFAEKVIRLNLELRKSAHTIIGAGQQTEAEKT